MKQSLEEYIEGRLQLGGCLLTILVIVFIIAVIVISINDFINNFSIGKLICVISFIPAVILIFWSAFKK